MNSRERGLTQISRHGTHRAAAIPIQVCANYKAAAACYLEIISILMDLVDLRQCGMDKHTNRPH